MSEAKSEALRKARDATQSLHRLVYLAVERGDMESAERHTADYLEAAATQDSVEWELVEGK